MAKKQKESQQQLFRSVVLELGRDKETLAFEDIKPLYDKWAISENLSPLTENKYNQLVDIACFLV